MPMIMTKNKGAVLSKISKLYLQSILLFNHEPFCVSCHQVTGTTLSSDKNDHGFSSCQRHKTTVTYVVGVFLNKGH